MEILELGVKIPNITNSLGSLNFRLEITEERINTIDNKMIKSEKKQNKNKPEGSLGKNKQSPSDLLNNIKRSNIVCKWSPIKRERGRMTKNLKNQWPKCFQIW